MKHFYKLVMLVIGLLAFTAATVKASEPVKPDTATKSGFVLYKKAAGGVQGHFIYTTGQIGAALSSVITTATFTSISLVVQGSDVFAYARGYDNDTPSIKISVPIGLTDGGPVYEVSTDMYAMKEICVADDGYCTWCEFTWIGRQCNCTQTTEGAPDYAGWCVKKMIPCICWMGEGPTPAQQFVEYLSHFTPQN